MLLCGPLARPPRTFSLQTRFAAGFTAAAALFFITYGSELQLSPELHNLQHKTAPADNVGLSNINSNSRLSSIAADEQWTLAPPSGVNAHNTRHESQDGGLPFHFCVLSTSVNGHRQD